MYYDVNILRRRLDQSHLMQKIFKDGKSLPNQLCDCLLLKDTDECLDDIQESIKVINELIFITIPFRNVQMYLAV